MVREMIVAGDLDAMTRSGKPVLAVDVDEVLCVHLAELNKWYNKQYACDYKFEDYQTYHFCETWQLSDRESLVRVFEFFETDECRDLPVIPGAVEGLQLLKNKYSLCVVTSRQFILKDTTLNWLNKHFGEGFFDIVLMGNNWVPDANAPRAKKSDMCSAINACSLVDDLPHYIEDASRVVKTPILFNFNQTYKWSQLEKIKEEVRTKCQLCCSWPEVVNVLMPVQLTATAILQGAHIIKLTDDDNKNPAAPETETIIIDAADDTTASTQLNTIPL